MSYRGVRYLKWGPQTPLNGFMKVGEQFLNGFALRCTSWYRRNLRPIATLFGLMHYHFDLHRYSDLNYRDDTARLPLRSASA